MGGHGHHLMTAMPIFQKCPKNLTNLKISILFFCILDNHFIGLPSPASATLCAVVVWQCHLNFIDPLISYAIISSTLSLSAALMVSSVKYNNFKDLKISNRMPFIGTLFIPLLMILILLNPPMILTIISVIFLISGPLSHLLSFFTKAELSDKES